MDPTAFDYEITGMKTSLYPEPGFRYSDKYGSVEVEVRFRRWLDVPNNYLDSTQVEGDGELARTLLQPRLHLSAASENVPHGLKGKVIGHIRLADYATQQAGRRGYDREGAAHYLVLAAQEFEKAGYLADFPAEFWEELLRAVEWLGLIEERNRIISFVGSTNLAETQTTAQALRYFRVARGLSVMNWRDPAMYKLDRKVSAVLELSEYCINRAQRAYDWNYFIAHCALATEELEKAGDMAGFKAEYWQELLKAVEWVGLIEHRERILHRLNALQGNTPSSWIAANRSHPTKKKRSNRRLSAPNAPPEGAPQAS
jgi:hypothetical protein